MTPKPRKGDTITLTIDKMAYGGRGVARINGFVIFVRGAVPGDIITAKIYKKKKSFAEADILEIIKPSSDRVEAPCPYVGHCGGCQWQHVDYERQLEFKREQIRESLEHIGDLKDVPVREVIPSKDMFAYRNKMEFSFSDRRWRLPHEMDMPKVEGDFALGLHVPGTYNRVIDIAACLLQQETGNRIIREVKKYVKSSGIPVYGLKSHVGFWRFLVLRYSRAFDEWMVNLVTSEKRPEAVQPLAEALCHKIDRVKTVVNNINGRKASIAVGEREVILAGDGSIRDRIGSFIFRISSNSFFQTNPAAAENLYRQIVTLAELEENDVVLDLYSGTGTIPIFVADRAKTVTGIEINENAVMDAEKNCMENGVRNCFFICGDTREALSAEIQRPDVMIIDPPRAGMHKDVLSRVLELSPERIVYVSCNPSTMARDMGQMITDYELLEIQPVDMFPHTYHVEAVAKLLARNKRG